MEALTKTVGDLQHQLDNQKKRTESFQAPTTTALGPVPASTPGSAPSSSSEMEQMRSELDELKNSQRQVKSGLFNPDISAAVDFITSYSQKANNVNFTPRDVELMVQSNVDQYAKAYIVFNAETELDPTAKSDLFNESSLGVEEAAIQTTSLPWGLEIKGGQFFADFTRLGKVHSHDLPFVDRPRSLDQILGGEAKARGFEANWLVPIPHYLRLTGGLVDNIGADTPITSLVQNADGSWSDDAAYADRDQRPFGSLMAYGRAATLFDLGPGTVLHLGTDYAQKNQDTQRRIASADWKLEWQPDPARYDQFEAGGEALWSRQRGALSQDTFGLSDADFVENTHGIDTDSANSSAAGGYVYAQYRLGKLWQPGVRVDYTHSNTFQLIDGVDGDANSLDKSSNNIWTYSAYLTLYLSEFNRLRLQLNYLHGDEDIVEGKGHTDLQAFFQWSIVLGAHKHDFAP